MKTAISEEEPREEEGAKTLEDATAVPVKMEAKRKLYTLTEDTVKTSIPAAGETEKQERLRKQREKQVRLFSILRSYNLHCRLNFNKRGRLSKNRRRRRLWA